MPVAVAHASVQSLRDGLQPPFFPAFTLFATGGRGLEENPLRLRKKLEAELVLALAPPGLVA